jgi:cytoskeleton-associated protein 5
MLLNLTAANPALVVDALIPYWDHKTPKTVIGSIAALSELIRNYGHAIPLKPILKNLAKLFDHRDKAVRTEVFMF